MQLEEEIEAQMLKINSFREGYLQAMLFVKNLIHPQTIKPEVYNPPQDSVKTPQDSI